MEQQKVDLFIMTNKDYFPAEKLFILKEKLKTATDEQFNMISCLDFQSPTTMLLISLFLGSMGVDRFMLKDTGMGILKLLTGGLCGILTLVDLFSISKKTKENNLNKILMMF